jgi:hypothetical protein
MTELTAYEFLIKNGIDPMGMHPSGVTNWIALDRLCEEKAKAAGMQPFITDEWDATPEGDLARVVQWSREAQS